MLPNLKYHTFYLALAFTVLLPSYASDTQRQNDHPNSKTAPPKNPIVSSAKDIQKSETYNIQSEGSDQEDYWIKRGVIVNVALAALTLGIGIVGAFQARAAFVNANNVANSERARMVLDIGDWLRTIIPVELINIGRTPAGIVYVHGFIEILSAQESLPKVPQYLTDKTKGRVFNWIKPGDRLDIPNEEKFVLAADLSDPATFNQVKSGEKNYFIFARVCYRDGISTDLRETRFCFRVYVDKLEHAAFELYGGKSYNKET
jgi:hypothetical protein